MNPRVGISISASSACLLPWVTCGDAAHGSAGLSDQEGPGARPGHAGSTQQRAQRGTDARLPADRRLLAGLSQATHLERMKRIRDRPKR